jgi:hypothetical protein
MNIYTQRVKKLLSCKLLNAGLKYFTVTIGLGFGFPQVSSQGGLEGNPVPNLYGQVPPE